MITIQQNPFPVESVKSTIAQLDLTAKSTYSSSIISYFNYYGLNPDGAHYFGIFKSQGFTCAAHVFVPHNAQGTVFLLHGYYDHTGILKNIIRLCVEQQLSVAVFDFPGHGLSTGAEASIDSFSQYVNAFNDFFTFCQPLVATPYFLIAHSMGGAVAFEFLHRTEAPPFKKVILLAPLIRCSCFHLSRTGYFLLKPFSDTVPRWFRNASSDRHFLKFFRNDPLQCHHFPLKWAKAFYSWNERIKSYDTISTGVTVIQGTKDTTVDWRYNIPFLKQKVANVDVVYIRKARHQLMNEGEPFLDEFLSTLRKQLCSE